MHLLLTFATPPSIGLETYLQVVKGFLVRLNVHGENGNVLKCIEKVPVVVNDLILIIMTI